ncbi:hypothetical protein Tco_0898978, partial [Tanacetum coccineum]
TLKETRALAEARKSPSNKGTLTFEVDECFGRIIGKDSQWFITKGGCVMRKYAKLDGTTWKKQPDLLKIDIISKTTKISNKNKKNRSLNEFPPTVGTLSLARRVDMNELRAEEDTWSCTAATICLKKLGYIPGHIKGRSASTKKILENVNLRSELKIAIKVMYLPHILLAAMASSRRIVSILATGAKTSSKSMPCSFGTLSLARRVDMSRKEGKEVSEIDQFKMAHYSKKRKGMINEKANIIWNELRAEEATSSCTPAEICFKKLGLQFLDI